MSAPTSIPGRGKVKGWRTIRYPDGRYRRVAIVARAGAEGGHTVASPVVREPGGKISRGAKSGLARVRDLAANGTPAQRKRARAYLRALWRTNA